MYEAASKPDNRPSPFWTETRCLSWGTLGELRLPIFLRQCNRLIWPYESILFMAPAAGRYPNLFKRNAGPVGPAE